MISSALGFLPVKAGAFCVFDTSGSAAAGMPILSEALERFPARKSGYPRLPQAMAAAERETIRVKRKNKHQMPVSMGVA
jgi:hypothetical protein